MSDTPTTDGAQASETLDPSSVAIHATVRRGQAAWQRLRTDQTFQTWLEIGAALRIGRADAMRDAHVNRPVGRTYNAAFAAWLKTFGFDSIDRGDRTRLFELMDNLPAVEIWRAALPDHQRLALNHPSSVVRRWKAATQSPDKPKRLSPFKQLKAAHVEALEQLHRAERELATGGGDLWTADDRAEDIADVMLEKLKPAKARQVAQAILNKLKQERQPAGHAGKAAGNPASLRHQ